MKSTSQEVFDACALVRQTETEIARLTTEGKRVHIIWDFDCVLTTPLSEDIFELVKYDLDKYFEYEARLSLSPPRPGIWLPLAKRVGELHTSQDIVTARSSFLAFRIMTFCMWHCGTNPSRWVRWILYLGHQSKADSFRIILESFLKDSETLVYFIDDNPKHVEVFSEVSQRLGMAERTVGIIAPKIRDYTDEQLKWHYDAVTQTVGNCPALIPGTPGGYTNGFLTLPDGLTGVRNLILKSLQSAEQSGAIEKFGPLLEMTFKDEFPDEPITPGGLYYAFLLLKGEAAHDTEMIKEILEHTD